MEQLFSQFPAVPLVLLMGAYELAKFLGRQGWQWLTGVAARGVSSQDCQECQEDFREQLRLGDARFALLSRAVAFLLEVSLMLCQASQLDCKDLEHKKTALIEELVSTGHERAGARG